MASNDLFAAGTPPGARGLATDDSASRRAWRRGGRWLVDRLLPHDCALCAAAAPTRICTACAAELPALPAACPVCAMPSASGTPCGPCVRRPPPFARTIAAHPYAFPVDRLVQSLKFGHRLPLVRVLADRVAAAVSARLGDARDHVDLVIPMPLAPLRLRERGFNQSAEIARRVAAALGVPCAPAAAARIRETRPQTELPPARRHANVRDAFAVDGAVIGLRVAIVDDVMTTGASLDALARAVVAAGGLHVENWVVARATGSDVVPR